MLKVTLFSHNTVHDIMPVGTKDAGIRLAQQWCVEEGRTANVWTYTGKSLTGFENDTLLVHVWYNAEEKKTYTQEKKPKHE